jgi:hypothetical protein
MSYFGIPRGRRKAIGQVRVSVDALGVATLTRDGVSEGVVTWSPAGWLELVSSAQCTSIINQIEIFDSTGNTGFLGTGAAGLEQVFIHVTPGGNGLVQTRIDKDTRISIKPTQAPSILTEFTINFYD